MLSRIHPEVLSRYYGCGLVVPELLHGARVLDLGCGSGRDVYLLAQLVGQAGSVVGVDMTPQQLAVTEAHRDYHAERFGFANVSFLEGTLERLGDLPLEPASFDLVVSNCVVNLCTDKLAVLAGVRRLSRSTARERPAPGDHRSGAGRPYRSAALLLGHPSPVRHRWARRCLRRPWTGRHLRRWDRRPSPRLPYSR